MTLETVMSKIGTPLTLVAFGVFTYGLWQRKGNLNFKSVVLDEMIWFAIFLAIIANPSILLNFGNIIINIINNILQTLIV